MNIFLRLKHWQLFTILIAVSLVLQIRAYDTFQITVHDTFASNRDISVIIWPTTIAILIYIFLFFGWLYAVGTNLYNKLPKSVPMSVKRFKLFLVIAVIYLLFLNPLNGYIASEKVVIGMGASNVAAAIVPVHLFSMFCMFYCLYFISKELKAVEWQRPVTFSVYTGEFFLIWFFPIGIWFIQPRINKLSEEGFQDGNDLSDTFVNNP